MSTIEIETGLASLGTEHPFRRAILALMDSAIEEEQEAVSQPRLDDAARHFNAGRLAHAIDFRTLTLDILERGKSKSA